MSGKLAGRTALVTGGTSGIGAATVALFAAEGARVVLTGRRTERGEAVARAAREAGGQAVFVPADHTRPADCEQAVARTLALSGRIDVLFNNAGIVMGGTAETTSEADWAAVMELNVNAVWRMCRLVLPHMRSQGGGVIVNNASDWGVVGAQEAFAYAVSKAAVVQMTRCLALDYASIPIRANAVCPGDTLVERWLEQGYFERSDPVTLEQAEKEASASLPLGRFGRAEEIARAVLFLACDDSSFMTGQTLVVDGGNTAR